MLQSQEGVSGTILVADDQPANRELLEELLRPQGYTVVSAPDGAAALELVSSTRPDLVILDVMMPRLSGFETCSRIKSNPETYLTPVVLVTALSSNEDRIEGIKAGADDFLTRPVDRVELLARVRSLMKLKLYTNELEHAESVLFALARAIEGKDPYTHGHCERLSEFAATLAQRFRLPQEQIVALRRAGIVHDIGKVAVPDAILLKPGRLTEDEMKVVREHPAVGERICAPLKSFRLVLPIIRHHHERCDGSGYPDGLRGEAIPMTARIMQIVDVFDALTTDRPYKEAFSTQKALATMREEVAKGWWDPRIFSEFESLVQGRSGDTRSLGAGAGA